MGLLIKVKGMKFDNWVGELSTDHYVSKYLDASGIDNSYRPKLELLINKLKDKGIWGKIIALYPFLGTTFEQMSYNLKDTSYGKLTLKDNPSIEITPDIGWKRLSGGYISTGIGFTELNNYHLLAYTDDDNGNQTSELIKVPIGVGATSNGSCIILQNKGYLRFRNLIQNGIGTIQEDYPMKGLIIASNYGFCFDGENQPIKTLTNGGFNNTRNAKPIVLGGYSVAINDVNNVVPTADLLTCQYKIAGMGLALTTDEMVSYSQILNDFKQMY